MYTVMESSRHGRGPVIRRVGAAAARDAGSTTGVATALLALLSAGMLAALGMVTAGQVRDLGAGPPGAGGPQPRPGVLGSVTLPGETSTGHHGQTRHERSPRGGVVALPTPLGIPAAPAVPTSAPVPAASPGGAPAGTDPGNAPAPAVTPTSPATPSVPAGPVLAGVDDVAPTPTPATSVLADKSGKRLGQVKHERVTLDSARQPRARRPVRTVPTDVEPVATETVPTCTAPGRSDQKRGAARHEPRARGASTGPPGRACGHEPRQRRPELPELPEPAEPSAPVVPTPTPALARPATSVAAPLPQTPVVSGSVGGQQDEPDDDPRPDLGDGVGNSVNSLPGTDLAHGPGTNPGNGPGNGHGHGLALGHDKH